MAKSSRGGRMTAAKSVGGKVMIKNRLVGKRIMRT